MTLNQFLAELSFVQLKDIKRHAKGLLLALRNSNRKEMLDWPIQNKEKCLCGLAGCPACRERLDRINQK